MSTEMELRVDLDAARAVIRAELDLYHAQHGHPRPVTICDLTSSYDVARRLSGAPRGAVSSPPSTVEGSGKPASISRGAPRGRGRGR